VIWRIPGTPVFVCAVAGREYKMLTIPTNTAKSSPVATNPTIVTIRCAMMLLLEICHRKNVHIPFLSLYLYVEDGNVGEKVPSLYCRLSCANV
jgi:hypothetical protein